MIDSTVFIARGALVMGDVKIASQASVWYNTVVRADCERIEIGEASNLQDLTMVHADPGYPCLVGRRVTVGHRCVLHGCIIEDECLIGMGAILLNGVRIGRGSMVGAGAVLTEGTVIPPRSLVIGVPGRVVRELDQALIDRIEHAWQHYVEQATRHRTGAFPIQLQDQADGSPG